MAGGTEEARADGVAGLGITGTSPTAAVGWMDAELLGDDKLYLAKIVSAALSLACSQGFK